MKDYISTNEAARIMNVTPRYVRVLAKEGVIDGEMVGRDWIVKRESAEQFQRQRKWWQRTPKG